MARRLNRHDAHTPQDLFLAWLVGLPHDVSVERAAMTEIARIDAIASPSNAILSLRGLLHQATLTISHQPRRRRTRLH